MSHSSLLRLAGAGLLAFTAFAPAAAEPQNQSAAASTVTSSDESTSTGTQARTDADAAKPKLICKTIDASESRMKAKKVCMTREQWRKADY